MPLSPETIAQKTFSTRVMGYDRDEVEGFLSEVAGVHSEALEEIDHLRELLANPDELLAEEVRDVLHHAREAAEVMLREANAALADARSRAGDEVDKIVQPARAEAQMLLEDAERRVETLRDVERQLRERLQDAVRSTQDALQRLETPVG